MKKKVFNKKLSLSKETIAHLNNQDMLAIKGGARSRKRTRKKCCGQDNNPCPDSGADISCESACICAGTRCC